jgi:hypothetical protein
MVGSRAAGTRASSGVEVVARPGRKLHLAAVDIEVVALPGRELHLADVDVEVVARPGREQPPPPRLLSGRDASCISQPPASRSSRGRDTSSRRGRRAAGTSRRDSLP